MKVTKNTKLVDFQYAVGLITEDSRAELIAQAQGLFGEYWQTTIGNFFAMGKGDFESVGINVTMPQYMTVLQYYYIEGFKDFCETFSTTMDNLKVKQSPEESRAAAACLPMSMEEGMLTFVRAYFGLPSFKAAEQVPLCDFLIAKKDKYNEQVFERTLQKIQTSKYTHK